MLSQAKLAIYINLEALYTNAADKYMLKYAGKGRGEQASKRVGNALRNWH